MVLVDFSATSCLLVVKVVYMTPASGVRVLRGLAVMALSIPSSRLGLGDVGRATMDCILRRGSNNICISIDKLCSVFCVIESDV